MNLGGSGAGGYAGGELLRLLSGHPEVGEIVAGSESLAGKPVTAAHPNLRKRSSLEFVRYDDVTGCDVLFLSLPNGAHRLAEFRSRGTLVVDLSSDHRLRDASVYRSWYEADHPHPELLGAAVYGMPELHRDEVLTAKLVTGAGCNATATILALLPLARAGFIDPSRPIVCLPKRAGVAPSLAPRLGEIGVLLPSAPLQQLLLTDVPEILVMTSGNRAAEPMAIDKDEAIAELAGIADAFLLHDRPIHARADDSVVRIGASGAQPVRRSRGVVPEAHTLPYASPTRLAVEDAHGIARHHNGPVIPLPANLELAPARLDRDLAGEEAEANARDHGRARARAARTEGGEPASRGRARHRFRAVRRREDEPFVGRVPPARRGDRRARRPDCCSPARNPDRRRCKAGTSWPRRRSASDSRR